MNGIPITNELSIKFKELYLQGESATSISKIYKRSHNSVSRHLKLQGVKIRDKSSAAKLGVIKGRIHIKRNIIIKQPKEINEYKAYILGTLCGDGWIYCNLNKKIFHIGLNAIDKDFVENFRNCLYKIYGIKRKIQKMPGRKINWKPQYKIRICSKAIYNDLLQYSDFKTKTWNIPKEIFNSQINIQSQFIKGFFDSEGTVDKRSNRVSAVSSNPHGLKQITLLLKNFGVRSKIKKQHPRNIYRLKIEDRKAVESYHSQIGFIIKRKQDKLNELVSNYKRYHRLSKDLKEITPEVVKLYQKEQNYSKVSKELHLPLTTVWQICQNNK